MLKTVDDHTYSLATSIHTIFTRIDAEATIMFVSGKMPPSIQGWLLFKGG